jgi:hypothetical protein
VILDQRRRVICPSGEAMRNRSHAEPQRHREDGEDCENRNEKAAQAKGSSRNDFPGWGVILGWPRLLETGAEKPQEIPRPECGDLSSPRDPGCKQPRLPEDVGRCS